MAATYEQYREQMLDREEAFTSFFYLDTRGFLTAGFGYLYVRDASGATAGASVQARAMSMLAQAGIALTQAQQNVVDGLVWAMHDLDASYGYPSFPNLNAFGASTLGQALAPYVQLKTTKVPPGVWTFQVAQAKAKGDDTWLPVEPLFDDPAKHSAYLALIVDPYETTIDNALAAQGSMQLTDSQRVGLFSAVWNRPAVAASIAAGLAASEGFAPLRARLAQGRSVSAGRLDDEAGLISGQTDVETLLPG